MRIHYTVLTAILASATLFTTPRSGAPADDLSGLWSAGRTFGPFETARVLVTQDQQGYTADMRGYSVPVEHHGGELRFALPNDQGFFRGKWEDRKITGHWFRPGNAPNIAQYASPVSLQRDASHRWSGVVTTLQDEFTFSLLLEADGASAWKAVLRNPNRDLGGQFRVTRLVREGNTLRLMGMIAGKEAAIATGAYDSEREAITLVFDSRGGSYDFTRAGEASDFYPRGRHPATYVYRAPPSLGDGWPTATLEDVNIDRPAMERYIQRVVETPQDSEDAPQIHAFLMARHGKLVMEEYFHGMHREKLHDTRSAGKSMTAILAGAVMEDGANLRLTSPVYEVMNGGAFPADLDPQKRTMTLEHLLTMSSGHFCDDTNDDAPGNEEKMSEQTQEPDYYRYILNVPLATTPGEKSVYCSAVANLALGMVGGAVNAFPLDAFDRLIAKPMRIGPYAWPLDPAGNPFGGGGVQFLPRDFIKFGQLMLGEGRWNGHRILSRDFARNAVSPQYHLRKITYGYLWWVEDVPYKNKTVRAFMALGAGGQLIEGIPDLDLVVAIYAGNYGSRTQGKLREAIPRYVLPAVREAGDDPKSPVVEREYANPYGQSPDGSRVNPRLP